MYNKIAHTAEHAFIGSLQKLLGQTVKVRKVEHYETSNTAFITISQLDLDLVFRAESEVNSLITTGRKITVHSFESLSEAKKCLPKLRANEERITTFQPVRVVEIEGHDQCACTMDHAENISDCEFFLVTRISKSGNEHEVNFVVGKQAKETAITLSVKLLKVCNEIGANLNTVENTVRKLKIENEDNLNKLKKLTREKLDSLRSDNNNNSGISIIQGIFSGLEEEEIRKFAGTKIAESKNTLIIVVNSNNDSDANANIVLARNEELLNVDCNKLFKQVFGADGQGGGKPHFVIGMIKKNRVHNIMNEIIQEIIKHKSTIKHIV
jgi:alanyl-tRNA synthetase